MGKNKLNMAAMRLAVISINEKIFIFFWTEYAQRNN